ncbi:cytoskeleton-associated protein 2-like [Genypterus blacodes]|uniref:cytoskeleton-associated protein 2-like n=1 Tax=Genypterus blacodes TaxID=154954 RepID=UPI003F76ACE9
MDEPENGSILSRKELRKQKLMEYLAAKGKLKKPNPRPYLRVDCQLKNPVTSAPKSTKGKENKTPAAAVGLRNESTKTGSGIPTGQQNVCRPTASSQIQRKLNEKPALTRTHTLVSTASNQSKKLQNTGSKSFSNAHHPAVTQSNSRSSSCTSAALSARPSSVCGRISLGPLVKTKTGLIPAVIQPRNTKSNLTCSSATAVDVRPSLANLRSTGTTVSQRPSAIRRETYSTRSVHRPVHGRITTTFNTRAEVQDQTKLTKRAFIKPPEPLSTRLRPQVMSSKCTVSTVKPDGKERIITMVKPVAQPSNKSAQRRTQAEPAAIGQTFRVASRTSSIPINSSRAVSRVQQATVTKPGGNGKVSKGTSANIPAPPQAGTRRTGIPVLSHTALRPARTGNQLGRTVDAKTPKAPVKVPQTERQKPTAAQEERMRKLREWREARGVTYKRPPMPVKPPVRRTAALPQPFWTAMKEEEDAHSLICAVDRSLADCIKLLKEGCPTDQVREVLSRLPAVSQKFAKYWICRARLMEQEGNLEVLPMFEEAVRVVLEPVDELRTVVFEILKRKDEIQASAENMKEARNSLGTEESGPEESVTPLRTPKPVRAFICGEKGDSTVKYKITATPGKPKSQQEEPARVNGQEVRFFTPVRRSVRIERVSHRYPASLQDHDLCVASYSDLIAEEEKGKNDKQEEGSSPVYIYRQNEALKDKVFVELDCDDVNKVLNLE